jgi:hypothetical protein
MGSPSSPGSGRFVFTGNETMPSRIPMETSNAVVTALTLTATGTAIALDNLSVAFFGVPVSMWVACFSGALFGATWLPADARVARPWAVITNTLAGIFLSAAVLQLAGIVITAEVPKALQASVGFLVSTAPLQVVLWLLQIIRGRLSSTAPPPSPPASGGTEGSQP